MNFSRSTIALKRSILAQNKNRNKREREMLNFLVSLEERTTIRDRKPNWFPTQLQVKRQHTRTK